MSEHRKAITIKTTVQAPLEHVWKTWTMPKHVQGWNAASDDWQTSQATNDLRVGGEFHYWMEAKDKSVGFDYAGTYTEVVPNTRIVSTLGDGRKVEVSFEETADGIIVQETFETEQTNPVDMQRSGWQAILDRFKSYAEGLAS